MRINPPYEKDFQFKWVSLLIKSLQYTWHFFRSAWSPVVQVSGPRSGPFRDYAGLLRASSYVLVWTCLDHHAQGPLGTFGDPCGGRRPTDNMCQKDGLLGRSGVQSLGESGRVGPCRTSDVRRSWRSWTEATKRGATSHQNPA